MIELFIGVVVLMFLVVIGLMVIGCGIAVASKMRKGSIVPKTTKRAVDQKIETVYRDKQVREVIKDLAQSDGWELGE